MALQDYGDSGDLFHDLPLLKKAFSRRHSHYGFLGLLPDYVIIDGGATDAQLAEVEIALVRGLVYPVVRKIDGQEMRIRYYLTDAGKEEVGKMR